MKSRIPKKKWNTKAWPRHTDPIDVFLIRRNYTNKMRNFPLEEVVIDNFRETVSLLPTPGGHMMTVEWDFDIIL